MLTATAIYLRSKERRTAVSARQGQRRVISTCLQSTWWPMLASPRAKRFRLDSFPGPPLIKETMYHFVETDKEEDQDHCIICLQAVSDRAVLPECAHDRMCFECIMIWTGEHQPNQRSSCWLIEIKNNPARSVATYQFLQSLKYRFKVSIMSKGYRCVPGEHSRGRFDYSPGPYIIHNIRSTFDYQKSFLPPMRTSPPPLPTLSQQTSRARVARERAWARRFSRNLNDEIDSALEKRKWVYRHKYAVYILSSYETQTQCRYQSIRQGIRVSSVAILCKPCSSLNISQHVASNPFTKYKPNPSPQQFSTSLDLIKRTTVFVRRELSVWSNLDREVRKYS